MGEPKQKTRWVLVRAGSHAEDSSKCGRNRPETMTLGKEDMHTYGHCPAHDDICLVVCSHCGQVVKPQAFEKHCERRHGHVAKTRGQTSIPLATRQHTRHSHPLSSLSSSKLSQRDGNTHEAGVISSAAIPSLNQHKPAKAQREAVRCPSVEKLPQENSPAPLCTSSSSSSSSSSSTTPLPRVPPLPAGPCTASTSPSESSSARPSAEAHSPLKGARTHRRSYKTINEKEYDLNKHCRLLDPEKKKLCSRELVCNTDSIHQQQKSLGKTQTFDQPTAEQRTAGRDMERLLVKSKDKEKHSEAFEDKIITPGSKCNFNSNCPILSRPRDPLDSFAEEEGGSTLVEVEVQPPYPFNQSLQSSGDSEDDEQEKAKDLPISPRHPRPLGLCTFGCQTLGCSIFTFDRRWRHVRFALSAMLERHVSTQLWKKMPQVTSSLRSHHHVTPTIGSTVREEARPSKSTGPLRLESTSQLETKSGQRNSHHNKPPSLAASAGLVMPGRRCDSAQRQQSQDHPRKTELIGVVRVGKSSGNIRDPSFRGKGHQPHLTSSQGLANGAFSQVKKPCPPIQRSSNGRFLAKQKAAGCERAGVAQKRKGGNGSSPAHKCQRLSSPSRSSLLAWRGENIGDVLGAAWRKDPAAKE